METIGIVEYSRVAHLTTQVDHGPELAGRSHGFLAQSRQLAVLLLMI